MIKTVDGNVDEREKMISTEFSNFLVGQERNNSAHPQPISKRSQLHDAISFCLAIPLSTYATNYG